jgi:hypothetical protein
MLPMLGRLALQYGIPTISGLLTAKDIYEKTGDIGKTLVGGGVATAGTWGLGKAGEALAGKAVGGLTTRFFPTATSVSLGSPMAKAMQGVYGAVPLATQAVLGAVPVMAGGLAASVTPGVFGPGGARRAQDALSGSMQLLGAGQQLTAPQVTGEWNPQAVPSTSAYGPDSYLRVADPFGPVAGQVLAGKLNALGQLEQQKILAPYALTNMDKVTDKDMLRQAAMTQLKTQLAQGAQAMSQAQLGAQALAQQGMGGMISAAAQRGGYV